MQISKLNAAVLVQFGGLLLFLLFWHPVARISGVVLIIVGGVMYRREQKRLKAAAATVPQASPSE